MSQKLRPITAGPGKKRVWNVKNDKIQEKRLTAYNKQSDDLANGHSITF